MNLDTIVIISTAVVALLVVALMAHGNVVFRLREEKHQALDAQKLRVEKEVYAQAVTRGFGEWYIVNPYGAVEFRWKKITNDPKEQQ